ncbi:glycine/D-amino acid oxidase-like deaminating enzyme [Amaricoccus macauensis]|uniref:Glycine/D-amino acid oxidase-like deaminating enzyme n=1 Tax=Amaricoccus macauensis TaxID=57001 RepID=A0A840SSJ7_9RHOB|nr:FAD-binding oxidoreductase [Amaricoccus macauensis]MBB5222786.1 glycine/D-amino acid oxidase-like deaminating enzyme [Amaricoccus macauensis]
MSRIIPDPVPTDRTLPQKVDVVVIGGGIAGVATTLFLAEKGVSVALCEKGLIAGEQSTRNWGWVRQMGRDPLELPLAIESLTLWRTMNARIGEETGFRQRGITYLCDTRRDVAHYEEWLGHARTYQLDSRLVAPKDLPGLLPGITEGRFLAGLHTATDGCAEPTRAAPAMARAAARLGAHVLTSCAVRSLETEAGRVSGVVTEHGPIRCASVVLAGGAWSRLFAGNLGIDFPQLKILGTTARIDGVSGTVPDMPVGGGTFAARPRLDGGYTATMRNANIAPITPDSFRLFADFAPTLVKSWHELTLRVNGRFFEEWRTPKRWAADEVSPFERVRILDPQPHDRFNSDGLKHLARAFPGFAGARITHSWAGLVDATPDAVPVIGPVGSIPGFYIASGFSGHGFGIGPGAGKLMAEIVTGSPTCVDARPFRLDRFRRSARTAHVEHTPGTRLAHQ